MKKFLVLYRAPIESFQQMSSMTSDQRKAGMDAWTAWSKRAGSAVVDLGNPLGKNLRITKEHAEPASNDLGGYSLLQADSKEALTKVLAGHPHFMTPGGFIDVLEVMPGL